MKKMPPLSRRDFLKLSGFSAAGLAVLAAGCSSPQAETSPDAVRQVVPPLSDQAYLAVAHGDDPKAIVNAALAALGGIERFVKNGHNVIIKPNICVDYHTPEYAATTNPDVVAALVTLALGAGAKRVRVMDMPFGGTPESAYAISGIESAVKAAGGEMEVMSPVKYAKFDIPIGKSIQSWEIYRDIMEADVVIDVPIAKHHSLARLTLGGKNLIGAVTKPNQIHQSLAQRIADLVSVIRPTLTVVDAYRILKDHGPTGGSLNDVEDAHTIIASHDIVTADAYGTTLFGLEAEDVLFVKKCAEMGLGTIDWKSVKMEEINV